MTWKIGIIEWGYLTVNRASGGDHDTKFGENAKENAGYNRDICTRQIKVHGKPWITWTTTISFVYHPSRIVRRLHRSLRWCWKTLVARTTKGLLHLRGRCTWPEGIFRCFVSQNNVDVLTCIPRNSMVVCTGTGSQDPLLLSFALSTTMEYRSQSVEDTRPVT